MDLYIAGLLTPFALIYLVCPILRAAYEATMDAAYLAKLSKERMIECDCTQWDKLWLVPLMFRLSFFRNFYWNW